MASRVRPSSLLWGLFLALGGVALVLRLWAPRHPALTWITTSLLTLLAMRLVTLVHDWRLGRIPGTRILLPALILTEGLGLVLTQASHRALQLRVGTALILELLLLILAMRAWRTARALPGIWPEDRIATAFEAFVPPRAARLMALELVMLGSAVRFLFGGFREAAPAGFTHHREAALRAILPAVPLMIPGDFLLMRAISTGLAPWLRWTLHGSTIYAVLWLVGLYATLKARPHQFREGRLELHLGLLKSAIVPVSRVLSASPLPEFEDDWARHAHMKGVAKLVAKGNAVLELRLSEPIQVTGLLGPGRPTRRLAVSVDDPAAFLAALGQSCA
ncbi:MAG: hypothetical protein HXX12_05210 [Geothrix sp.]|uniref:hypothetical protein n=1 Tax=Geothrix sp. TaxID=1962974 RepID=UPI00180C729C|nr:hypothetical protein [Geothrix sp.]NWJ40353.1 hypothetical protein [Geothrix sp.]WIL21642.1 MAG: hypothetical protein QOZ81_000909 [Geothrix sp.]